MDKIDYPSFIVKIRKINGNKITFHEGNTIVQGFINEKNLRINMKINRTDNVTYLKDVLSIIKKWEFSY
jgi:hypothetical protein